jgi:hypothetical protein
VHDKSENRNNKDETPNSNANDNPNLDAVTSRRTLIGRHGFSNLTANSIL